MPSSPDDDAPDMQALFDQTIDPPTQAQRERWTRHAATLPDRPRRRRWWWLLPAVPAVAATAFLLWPRDPGPVVQGPDLAPSGAPAAIGPVPSEEMGGLELLIAAADDTASPEDDPEDDPAENPSADRVEDPPRVRAGRMPAVTQDPLRVLDGQGDPVGPLEMLSPPARPHLERQLAAFESLLEEER